MPSAPGVPSSSAHVRSPAPLSATTRTAAHQAPQSAGSLRQEDWSGLPCPPPGDLPEPGIKPVFFAHPAPAGGFFCHWGWLGSTKVSLIKWEQGWWWCGGPGQTPLTYRHSVFPSPHHSLLSLSTANTKTRTPGPACYPKVNSTASPKLHPATGTSAVKRWHPPDAHNGNLGVEMQPCSPHPINLQVTPIH